MTIYINTMIIYIKVSNLRINGYLSVGAFNDFFLLGLFSPLFSAISPLRTRLTVHLKELEENTNLKNKAVSTNDK